MGSMLVATVALALIGVRVVLLTRRDDPWWRFVLYGLLVSPIPGALTIERYHALRLIALPVFVLVLAGLGLAWLGTSGRGRSTRELWTGALLAITLVQAAIFQWQFHAAAPSRGREIEHGFPPVYAAALATPSWPIYLVNRSGSPVYIHAYWYGALWGVDQSRLAVIDAGTALPAGALGISTDDPCPACPVVARSGSFVACTGSARERRIDEMKLAVFSPLNPLRSGISDYTEQLLPYLARFADVDLFVAGFRPSIRTSTEASAATTIVATPRAWTRWRSTTRRSTTSGTTIATTPTSTRSRVPVPASSSCTISSSRTSSSGWPAAGTILVST